MAYRGKKFYTCIKCKHKFESFETLEPEKRICGLCRLDAIYGKRRER